MPAIWTSRTRTRQPPPDAPVHPEFASALTRAWIAGAPVSSMGAAVMRGGRHGIGLSIRSASASAATLPGNTLNVGLRPRSTTLAIYSDDGALSDPANGQNIYSERADSTIIHKIGILRASNEAFFVFRNDVLDLINGPANAEGRAPLDTSRSLHVIAYIVNGTASRIMWADGRYGAGSTSNFATPTAGNNETNLCVDSQDAESYSTVSLMAVATWGRALGRAELADIARNPWDLFAPVRRPVFYSLPPTVGGPNNFLMIRRPHILRPRR